MHERHTLYRREQAADWNYRPSEAQALPLGPVAAISDPSPSYYAAANAEQINAQQKAYAEALLEQNRLMKARIDALQKNQSVIESLHSEVERPKKELSSRKESAPAEEDMPSDDFSLRRAAPERAEDPISDPGEILPFSRSDADCQAFLVLHWPQRRTGEGARCPRTAQTPQSSLAALSIHRLAGAHHQAHTMNQLKLSLRAADDPRTIKAENGLPVFASVFSLHNAIRNGREEALPITVKASHELAQTSRQRSEKGSGLRRGGSTCRPQERRNEPETYSVWAEKFSEITRPTSTPAKAGQSL